MASSSSSSLTKKFQPLRQSPNLAPSPASPTAPVIAASSSLSHASHLSSADYSKPVTARPSTTTPDHTPPYLALASAEESCDSKIPTVVFDLRSAPIPIPAPRPNVDAAASYTPSTPLTARERAGGHFPLHKRTPAKPQLGRSLTPRYAQHPHPGRHINYFSDDSNSPSSSVGSTASMHRDRPSSPLSPSLSRPLSPISPIWQTSNQNTSQPTPRPAQKLQLNSLPRFHPAKYESPSSSAGTTPRNSRPGTAQTHLRQFSDAQAKVHQYQRDIVANATRAASLTLSPKTIAHPISPRLNPLGSSGPVTPLMLEGGDDYFIAGSLGSPDAQAERGRELVQRLVQKENERRKYPSRSESHSPAVSPAGGRG